jgi:diguanylate cyclase (GGDEF)-like protein
LNKAHILAEKLRQTIATTPVTCQDQQLSITVSIGIASGYDLETLLPQADAAMYQAKTEGRNRTVTGSSRNDATSAALAACSVSE